MRKYVGRFIDLTIGELAQRSGLSDTKSVGKLCGIVSKDLVDCSMPGIPRQIRRWIRYDIGRHDGSQKVSKYSKAHNYERSSLMSEQTGTRL